MFNLYTVSSSRTVLAARYQNSAASDTRRAASAFVAGRAGSMTRVPFRAALMDPAGATRDGRAELTKSAAQWRAARSIIE